MWPRPAHEAEVMDLTPWIDRRDGIVHRLDALDAGATKHGIERAKQSGSVRVVRRNWLVTAACDPQLLFAATRGGRLTCLTIAGRRGWWNLADGFVHLSVPSTSAATTEAGLRLHWSATPAPVSTRTLVQPPVNALVHIAECQPFERALAVFESAVRVGDADLDRLRLMPIRSRRFSRVIDRVSHLSDSGIESIPRRHPHEPAGRGRRSPGRRTHRRTPHPAVRWTRSSSGCVTTEPRSRAGSPSRAIRPHRPAVQLPAGHARVDTRRARDLRRDRARQASVVNAGDPLRSRMNVVTFSCCGADLLLWRGEALRELDDELHLDGRVEREHGDADGGAGVHAEVAEDLAEDL